MKKLRELKHFHGLEIEHCDNGVFLGQNKCTTDLLRKSGMENCKPNGTLIEVNCKLSKVCKDMEGGLLEDDYARDIAIRKFTTRCVQFRFKINILV